MSRKTIDVTNLKVQVNDMLAKSYCATDVRIGMIGVLDMVLHQTGNYKGYRYLSSNEVPVGFPPGINTDEQIDFPHSLDKLGTDEHDDNFVGTDDTRREYI